MARAARVLEALFRCAPIRDFDVRLWDGSTWRPPTAGPARFTLTIRDPSVLRRLVLARDEVALGQDYVTGRLDLEGDLEGVVRVAEVLLSDPPTLKDRVRILAAALGLPRSHAAARRLNATSRSVLRGRLHSRERDRSAVAHHYDVSNEFFQLFLDSRMVYTCAYFGSREELLEHAQLRKLDYVCRKLRLRPGERLLDVGCGWGALVLHAAEHFGVLAEGITLSEKQAALARERIHEAGLDDRCSVRVADYRDLDESGRFDKIASIGMFEHVGKAAMDAYFRRMHGLLRPGGVFLNHAIGAVSGDEGGKPGFGDRWVFPDHELLAISTMLRGAETAGLEVRDVENLREHYALTLRHWLRRLEARREEAVRLAGDATWRAWRLVFAGAAHQLDSGRLHLYQTLLVKPGPGGSSGVPLTREDWYSSGSMAALDLSPRKGIVR